MHIFILLSLSALLSVLIFKKPKGDVNESTLREKSQDRGKNVNKHVRTPRIFIPDLLARWPWPRQANPHYAIIKEETAAWLENFQALGPEVRKGLDHGAIALCTSLAYPNLSREHARAGCDFLCLLYTIDDYAETCAPSEVRTERDIILHVFRNPHEPRPNGEWVGGEMARQFWENNMHNATEVSRRRFIRNMDEYLQGVMQESIERSDQRILDIESYIEKRRRTVASKAVLSMIELGLDIPDEVMSHPAIQEMIQAAADHIAICNDVFSYDLEQMRGEDLHNIITCVMSECHTDINGAILWVEDYISGVIEKFLAAFAALPQLDSEPLNSHVEMFCNGLGLCVRGIYEWSFESERYFGKNGPEVKKNKWISLSPEKSAIRKEVGQIHVGESLYGNVEVAVY